MRGEESTWFRDDLEEKLFLSGYIIDARVLVREFITSLLALVRGRMHFLTRTYFLLYTIKYN